MILLHKTCVISHLGLNDKSGVVYKMITEIKEALFSNFIYDLVISVEFMRLTVVKSVWEQ